jgi:hypothetical protein
MGFAGKTNSKERPSRQTHKQGNNNNNEGKQHSKNTNGNMQSVTSWKRRQKTSVTDSFKHMKIKISYTLEDGHVGRNT